MRVMRGEMLKCDRKGHKSFECPRREKRKKYRRGDAYEDHRIKQKKLRVRVEDSDGTERDTIVLMLAREILLRYYRILPIYND